ncbi:MAG: hypothetical protein JXR65_06705 [Bacteroidales bacterium]|nr:hypothetical protein [Bacteroidales bacterium]
MDKNTFASHLEKATNATLEVTKEHCWNVFSENILYIIKPNDLKVSKSLDADEKRILRQRIKELNKKLTLPEVVVRLTYDKRVPARINISVNKSTKNETTIELKTSRRLIREPNHSHDLFPPFHISIPVPPLNKEGQNFDVNWQHRWWTLNVWLWKRNQRKQKRKKRIKRKK